MSQIWPPPPVIFSVAGKIRNPNLTTEPPILKRHEHFFQICAALIMTEEDIKSQHPCDDTSVPTSSYNSDKVAIDPVNMLAQQERSDFCSLLRDYDEVFNSNFKGYNGAVGSFEARINMGPVQPPQLKGRIPQYSRDNLKEL